MKLLYGVQGTGNGHISRANAIGASLQKYPDVDITWLFSGRRKEDLFGVADNFLWRRGMTFASDNGRVSYLETLRTNNLLRYVQEVRELRLDEYDTIIVDFEPVTGWASKLRRRPTIGIGHQYAFAFGIPTTGDNLAARSVLRYFAPATESLGLHWHHFNYPILPPVVDLLGCTRDSVETNKVIVYLPFENQDTVIRMLRNIGTHEFYIYAPGLRHGDTCNIHTRAPSQVGFKQDLVNASAVICNSGFELISECLTLGIRVLTKPLDKQMEQLSNAFALEQLHYAAVMHSLDEQRMGDWLQESEVVRVDYPLVHEHIADWIVGGRRKSVEDLASGLWEKVTVTRSTPAPASVTASV